MVTYGRCYLKIKINELINYVFLVQWTQDSGQCDLKQFYKSPKKSKEFSQGNVHEIVHTISLQKYCNRITRDLQANLDVRDWKRDKYIGHETVL